MLSRIQQTTMILPTFSYVLRLSNVAITRSLRSNCVYAASHTLTLAHISRPCKSYFTTVAIPCRYLRLSNTSARQTWSWSAYTSYSASVKPNALALAFR